MKKTLFAFCALLATLQTMPSSAQEDNLPAKGVFLETYTPPVAYEKITEVYAADAGKMATEWTSAGFAQNSKGYYSTGSYAANADIYANAPAISLPRPSAGEKVVLHLKHRYETETAWDFLRVEVNGEEAFRISGKTGWVDNYIDLSRWAGKDAQISLHLASDGTIQGNGWDIQQLEVMTGVRTIVPTAAAKARKSKPIVAATAGTPSTITIQDIKSETFPEAIFVDFTVTDGNGNFVPGLTEDDFVVTDYYSQMLGCRKLIVSNSVQRSPVDIVFLVDNSGSMQDNQQKVKAAVSSLLDSLEQTCDARVGLVRFGQTTDLCPEYGVAETGLAENKFFFSVKDDTDFSTFKDEIWNRNVENGYYEPYYEVLNWAAAQSFDYRSNARKVFILLGDESPTDSNNNKKCDHSTMSSLSATAVGNILANKNIQVFCIVDNSYASLFTPITTATNGEIGNIESADYNEILGSFASSIKNTYTLRYCLDIDPSQVDPTVERPVTVALSNDTNIFGTSSYNPIASPNIFRTEATIALDAISQNQNVNVPVGVIVKRNGYDINDVKLYYKDENASNYIVLQKAGTDGTPVGDLTTFDFVIPASSVNPPHVKYYFEATTHNAINDKTVIVKTPPSKQDFFAWTFPVKPNYAPVISDKLITPSTVYPCMDVEVCVTITDETEYVKTATLSYKVQKTPAVYNSITMTANGNRYCGTIPAMAVKEDNVEWFITAEDNNGTLGWYGTAEYPQELPLNNDVPESSSDPLTLIIGTYANVIQGCEAMKNDDELYAYFVNNCGDLQLAGHSEWNGHESGFNFNVYKDSDPTDGRKDGYYENEKIILKLLHNGKLFDVTPSQDLHYYTGDARFKQLSGVVGAGVPHLEVKENNTVVSNDTIVDFGVSQTSVSKTFTIQNVGCEVMAISRLAVSDDTNFTLTNPIASDLFLYPGDSHTFTVTYSGQSSATATVYVSTNANPQNFSFKVRGTHQSNPCEGVEFNDLGVLVEVSTSVEAGETLLVEVCNVQGGVLDTVANMTINTDQTYTSYIVKHNYGSGVYIITVIRNGIPCSHVFIN